MSAPQLACYGRLGRDPRTPKTRTGKPMTTASPSVHVKARERWADDAEATSWLGVVAFGRVAEGLDCRRSGVQLSASGRLQLSRYKATDGTTRKGWQCVADAVVSARSARPGGGKRSTGAKQRQGRSPAPSDTQCPPSTTPSGSEPVR